MPSPALEKHKLEVENLKWQIEYENKLHDKLSQILENKVSGLMAQVKRMQKDIDSKAATITEQLELTAAQTSQIKDLESSVKKGQEEIILLRNENEQLIKKKGIDPSKDPYGKLESEVALKREEVEQQASQIVAQAAEIHRLQATLKDFHSRVVKLDRYTKHQTETLQEAVDAKILAQANRI